MNVDLVLRNVNGISLVDGRKRSARRCEGVKRGLYLLAVDDDIEYTLARPVEEDLREFERDVPLPVGGWVCVFDGARIKGFGLVQSRIGSAGPDDTSSGTCTLIW